jgi:hypothetical protein
VGLALGAFSAVGDRSDLVLVNGMANAAGPWLLAAFLVGKVQRTDRCGALAGATALLTGVAAYYAGILLGGNPFPLALLFAWAVIAAASGAAFGIAGVGRAFAGQPPRTVSAALVSGALLAEAAHRLIRTEVWTGIEWHRTDMQVAAADTLLAIVVLLVLAGRRGLSRALAMMLPVVGLGVLMLAAAESALRWALAIMHGPA